MAVLTPASVITPIVMSEGKRHNSFDLSMRDIPYLIATLGLVGETNEVAPELEAAQRKRPAKMEDGR